MTEKEKILSRVQEHLDESKQYFNSNNIVVICLQGSQNYGLQVPGSDVDTKLILTPSFKDIVMVRQPVSTTHVRANEEHTDWKDIRLMFQTFRKQNLNFVEVLFTPYYIVNENYTSEWNELISHNEEIAHYSPYRAVKTMKGIALEKFHALTHEYPSKVEVIAKYGYDPKQLHHLLRVENYLERYIGGETYAKCLHPDAAFCKYLKDVKLGCFNLEEATALAKCSLDKTVSMADHFCELTKDICNKNVDDLLDTIQYNIIKKSVERELN
jgi:predicted nucleotidyltransferase